MIREDEFRASHAKKSKKSIALDILPLKHWKILGQCSFYFLLILSTSVFIDVYNIKEAMGLWGLMSCASFSTLKLAFLDKK
jgi:hypothetical protein